MFLKEELDSKKVYEAAMEGDELAKEIFEYTGKILGMALANFVMFSSPKRLYYLAALPKPAN
jgi:glucokinase